MNAKECEREVFMVFKDQIRQSCIRRWGAIEEDDRIAEATLVFLAVLRTPNLPEERVWAAYEHALAERMPTLSRKAGKDRFHFSLDAKIKQQNGMVGSAYVDFLIDPETWKSQAKVERFLTLLPEPERSVCIELIADPSCRKASRTLRMPLAEVKRIRERIMHCYISFAQNQVW